MRPKKSNHRQLVKCVVVLLAILLILAACEDNSKEEETATLVPTPEVAAGVIVVGDVDNDDPVAKLEEFQPIADYLAANLGDYGIGVGEVKVAPDLETMIAWMESGEVDVYYDSLYPAMIVSDQSGAKPLVRGWRGGEPIYHTVFFALADSGLNSLEDVEGELIAFDDVSSTSGYMLPVSYMISNGLKPVEKPSEASTVADDEVGYIFSGDDENTIEWVLSGRVKVGVTDNLTFLADVPEETRAELVILAETEDVPRRVVMVGADLEPELVDALKVLLVDLDEAEGGQAILDILRTKEFDDFPGGVDTVFARIRELYELVSDQ
jgi:phosphonate transport system substrate-binding protein